MGVETYKLQRMDSVCSPEADLLKYVAKNEIDNIRSLVCQNPKLLSTIYGHPYNKPILYIAVSEFAKDGRVFPITVKTLIDLGADPHYIDESDDYMEALHFATLSQNSSILQTIIDNIGPENINATTNENTALNLLIKQGEAEDKDFEECTRKLLAAGINVNKADKKNATPILWAAQKGYKNIVRLILNNCSFVDVDSHKIKQKTARQLILEKNLYDGELPEANTNNNESAKEILFRYIKEGKEDEFLLFPNFEEHVDEEQDEGTLLQLACKLNRKRIVDHLLKNNASFTKRTLKNNEFPIEIAAGKGYYEIFNSLLLQYTEQIPAKVLPTLLANINNHTTNEINYKKCLDLLLNKKKVRLDVNAKDSQGNTPLHYSTRYADPDTTLSLLKLGASLGDKNRFDMLPVEDIDAATLEEHFDNCISTEPKMIFDKQGTVLTFDYKTLLPTETISNVKLPDLEAGSHLLPNNKIPSFIPETDVVHLISKSPELRHLLNHPLITSFLYIKWHRMRFLFYTNLAFYVTFCLSLALYILLIYCNEELIDQPGVAEFLSTLLVITFLTLTIREVFQIIVSPKTYFFQFENWIEMTLVIVTFLILSINSPQPDTVRQLSSTAILLAALEMMLIIGQIPQMSTNIVMLRTVSCNFFKFLLWYAILLLAFALSFYTLFKKSPEQPPPNNSTSTDEEKEQDLFLDPGLAIIKTIVMLTGEFDATSINFDLPLNRIIFVLFVFMIAIILLNLLNGLAVSDTQMIKNDAEIIAHVERINHIVYIERMVLGNLIPNNIIFFLRKLCCCCFQTENSKNFNVPKPLAKLVCLFPEFLKEKRLQVFMNQEGKMVQEKKANCFGICRDHYLDRKTRKRVKSLLQMRQVKQQFTSQCKLLQQKEELIQDLQQIIKSQQETIRKLTIN